MEIVLASSSGRRRKLLGKIARKFRVKKASVDERVLPGETFPAAAMRLAEKKAGAIAKRERGAVVIGADTIAYRGKKIYRKTSSAKTARKILLELSGKTHFVVTGVAILFPDRKRVKYFVKAAVRMKKYGEKELQEYLRSKEWKGRAGCYDYSGRGRRLVQSERVLNGLKIQERIQAT